MYVIRYRLELVNGRYIKYDQPLSKEIDIPVQKFTSKLIKELIDSDYFHYTYNNGAAFAINMRHVISVQISVKEKEEENAD